jgi:hypothetical protein
LRTQSLGAALDAKILAAFEQLEKDSQQFEQSIHFQRGSIRTPQIIALDKERDLQCGELLRRIKYLSKTGAAEQRENANKVSIFLKAYGNLKHQHIHSETDLIFRVLQHISDQADLEASFKTLELLPLLQELQKINDKINHLSLERDAEFTEHQQRKGQGIKNRKQLTLSYEYLCNMVLSLWHMNPNAAVGEIFSVINRHRKEYHTLLQQRKGKNKNAIQNNNFN